MMLAAGMSFTLVKPVILSDLLQLSPSWKYWNPAAIEDTWRCTDLFVSGIVGDLGHLSSSSPSSRCRKPAVIFDTRCCLEFVVFEIVGDSSSLSFALCRRFAVVDLGFACCLL